MNAGRLTVVVIASMMLSTMVLADTRSNNFYVVSADAMDGGGSHSASENYAVDGSVGSIGGVSSSSVDATKNGYIGQLTEVTGLSVTGTPVSINQGATSQLSGTVKLDDSTVTALASSDVAWGFVTYPFLSVDSNGLLTAVANVYASPVGTVNGFYLGATGSTSVQVLGPYASAGIADLWLVQYFGLPPNPNAAPYVDADGTGQNNLFKYIAGLNPTNPTSIFVLQIASVPSQPTQKNLIFSPVVGGRIYTVQFSTDLVSGAWAILTGIGGPVTNGNQVTITDLNATQLQKFYRIGISLP